MITMDYKIPETYIQIQLSGVFMFKKILFGAFIFSSSNLAFASIGDDLRSCGNDAQCIGSVIVNYCGSSSQCIGNVILDNHNTSPSTGQNLVVPFYNHTACVGTASAVVILNGNQTRDREKCRVLPDLDGIYNWSYRIGGACVEAGAFPYQACIALL